MNHVNAVLRTGNPHMSKRDVAERVGVLVLTACSRTTVGQIRIEFDEGPVVTLGKKRPLQIAKTMMTKYTDLRNPV